MNSPMERVNELLASVDTEIAALLREQFVAAYETSFSNGFDAGLRTSEEQHIKSIEKFKNIGEARGITWAYHAIQKNKVRDVLADNPYANPHLVNGLLGK